MNPLGEKIANRVGIAEVIAFKAAVFDDGLVKTVGAEEIKRDFED
jgi:hypothetical protein